MKIKMMLAMGLGALCGLAGNVCTWSGAAGTGRLGDAGNWDTLPVSGNGDTLNFDAASGTLTNDFSVLEVARMTFLGTEEVKLTGGKIVFNAPGTEVWNNFAKVVLDVPFQVSGEGDSKFYVYGSIDFLKPVTIDDKAAMMGWGPVQDGTRSPTLRVHFYETVTGGGTESKLYLGYGRGSHTYFHKTVGVAALKNSNLYNRDYVHFMAPENNVTYYQPCYTFFVADCVNVWGTNHYLTGGTYYTGETGTTVYDFQTYDQTIIALHQCDKSVQVTSAGATLTLRPVRYSYGYSGAINGATTIVIDSPEKKAQNFYQAIEHKTTGTIIVKSGTFGVYGTATFARVPTAVVEANGNLTIGSAATARPVFGGLKDLTIANGGQFIVGADCTLPLTDNFTTFHVGSSAVVTAPGKTLRLKSVFVDGVACVAGTYTAANASWIADDGTTVVAAETPQQWTAGSGDWNTVANWMNGVPTGSENVEITRPQADYTVMVSDARTLNGGLEVANASGAATLQIAAGGSLTFDGAGTARAMDDVAVRIGAGGRLFAEGAVTVTNLMGRFEVRDGGVLAVTNAAFELKTLATDATATNHALYVMKGGRMAFGGTATFHVAADQRGAPRHLVNDGGEIRFGGESVYYAGEGWTTLFGSGTTVFEGAAQLMRGPGTLNQCRYYLSPTRQGPENVARCEFRDAAKWALTGNDSIYVNYDSPDLDNYVKLVFDSTGNNSVGEFKCGLRGHTETEVKRGWLHVSGGYGMNVGSRASEYAGTQGDSPCTSVVHVAEHAILHLACGWVPSRGLLIGNGRVNTVAPRRVLGIVETAGVVTNWYGDVLIGMGAAEGRYVMTGGNFHSRVSETNRVIVAGFANGLGIFTVSNGVFAANRQPIYVGGIPMSEFNAVPGSSNLPEPAYAQRHDAEGFMTVAAADASKPCRVTTDAFYVGKDGTGTVEVGPGGRIVAGTVKFANGAKSRLKFVADATGAGLLECGALEISSGAKLEIDAARIAGAASRTLMTWNSAEGAFAVEDVVCTAPGGWRLLVGAKEIRLIRSGMAVTIR